MKILQAFIFIFFLNPSFVFAHRLVTTSEHAMVVSDQHLASQVGLDILNQGGNAIDAAIAVGYALAVTEPCCGNIGGGGFMLIRLKNGEETFINFRESAPTQATQTNILAIIKNYPQHKGWPFVAVPGTVKGFELARKKFSTLPISALLAPAIKLAKEGFKITSGDLYTINLIQNKKALSPYNFSDQKNVKSIFMPNGKLPSENATLKQPGLAASLAELSNKGEASFYQESISKKLVKASQENGGFLSQKDLRDYNAELLEPIHCHYRGYDIITAPPPSSGGIILCQILKTLEAYPLSSWGWHSTSSLHAIFEAERYAFAEGNYYLGDPNFIQNPIAQLLSPEHINSIHSKMTTFYPTPSEKIDPEKNLPPQNQSNTTHYSIVDKEGNAVAVTYSLNSFFGAGVMAGDTGFFLNNQLNDFTLQPGEANVHGLKYGTSNTISAGKRPSSSMSPTIVTKDGQLVMVLGSPGGSRIPTIVLETLLNVIDYHMNPQDAADAPRTHMQWYPDKVEYEAGSISLMNRVLLRLRGYHFEEVPWWGSMQIITINPLTQLRAGGSDARHSAGAARGS